MTWDGIPEHRNIGDGSEPPKTADDYRREIADWLGNRPRPVPPTPAEYIRAQADRMGRHAPDPDPMPADPFNGITEAALAQVAMIEAVQESGLSELSALFYVACSSVQSSRHSAGGLGQLRRSRSEM